jgi:MFS family permease
MNFVQIAGIIVGMLFFGTLGDIIGRCWGSRIVASIMLSGSIMLVFTPFVPNPLTYLQFFIFAQTFYGFGVGGEVRDAFGRAVSFGAGQNCGCSLSKQRTRQDLPVHTQP